MDRVEYTKRIPNTHTERAAVSRSVAFGAVEFTKEDLEWILNGGCVVHFDGEYDNFFTLKKEWC